MQHHSRISCLAMKLDPIHTTLGDIAGVGKVNHIPVRSNFVLIGEVLKSGEVDAGSVGQVLSVDAKRPIEQWTKGLLLAFMIIRFVIRFVIWFVVWFVIRVGVILGVMVLGVILGMLLGMLRFGMTPALTFIVIFPFAARWVNWFMI